MSYRAMSSKRGGAWTKVVIFVSLYVLLLESLVEWVIALYLYGNKHVDTKMAPSLIFALAASFFTVPLVVLHSFLAWQYNKVLGYARQKAMLQTACTYIMRITTIIWLGASVAGLVVVSQQAYCFPEGTNGSFWNVGVSCALHRAVVIVSVLSFITVCLYFCSRELCECPYNVSLLGVYNHRRSSQDGSILSASTLRSEKNLKNDILCVCRHPDITYGRAPYITPSQGSEEAKSLASIQQPTPMHPTSWPRFSPDPEDEAEYLSGRTITPGMQSDPFSVSRTPSTTTAQTSLQAHSQDLPELPGAIVQPQAAHTRNKSSTSSLRRFLPKSLPISLSLSSDPQIRALAEPKDHMDIEKQVIEQQAAVKDESGPSASAAEAPPVTQAPMEATAQPPPPPPNQTQTAIAQSIEKTASIPRSTTMNSADAPEVVSPPAPDQIRRSNTTQTVFSPLTSHPNPAHIHTPPPSLSFNTAPLPRPSSWATPPSAPTHPRPFRVNSNSSGSSSSQTMRPSPLRRQSLNHSPISTPVSGQQYTPYIPRYTQSQRFPGPRKNNNRNRYSRHLRRNDTEVLYQHPGSRRPRSSTMNMSIATVPGHLDCIRETGASIDEMPPGDGRVPGIGPGRGC